MTITFEHLICLFCGFLFGLLVSVTAKMTASPESELIKQMLDVLKKRGDLNLPLSKDKKK